MSYNKNFITAEHLVWAADNRVIITEGECGFGRECVGITAGNQWVDWRVTNMQSYQYEEGYYDGFVPDTAYHKHDCVCVLGQDDAAWADLMVWLDNIIQGGWIVLHLDREPKDTLDLLFHGTKTAQLGKPA